MTLVSATIIMASCKGQGNNKGKQPTKKRPVPQVSLPQSSLAEECWPVWQPLQEKISVLEAKQLASQAPQPCEAQLCRSAREAKSHHRAKLKAIANDFMSQFAVLKEERDVQK